MASTQFDSPKDAGERNVSGAKEYSVCDQCRTKKVRCGKERPSCSNCIRNGIECKWLGSGKRRSQTVMLNNAVNVLEGRIERLEKNLANLQAILERLSPINLGQTEGTPVSASSHSPAQSRRSPLQPEPFHLIHRIDGSQQYVGRTSLDSLMYNFTQLIEVSLSRSYSHHDPWTTRLLMAKDRLRAISAEVATLDPVNDSLPASSPPLGILAPMIDPYFDNLNPHMPIWSRNYFRSLVDELQLSQNELLHKGHDISLHSVAILTLTAKLSISSVHSRPSSPSWSSIDMEFVKYFLSNAMKAVQDFQDYLTQRLSNVQALLALHLVAQIHLSPERANLFLELAAAGAKLLGLGQWEPLQGHTPEEIRERRNVFLCLYILDKSRCWTDGQPPNVLMEDRDTWLSHQGGIDPSLVARARLSHIEEKVYMGLYSDNTIDRQNYDISSLGQELQQFCNDYALDDIHNDGRVISEDPELSIVACALKVFIYWRTDAQDAVLSASQRCLSLFMRLWEQDTGLGNHLTIARIMTSYAPLSFFQLCSFITLNPTEHSAIDTIKSFVMMLHSISRIAETNVVIKKMAHVGEIVLDLASNQPVTAPWPKMSDTGAIFPDQNPSLHMIHPSNSIYPVSEGLKSIPETSASPRGPAPSYDYSFGDSPTSLAMIEESIFANPGAHLNVDFADLELQQWASELQDDALDG